jgi:hypothetical protein
MDEPLAGQRPKNLTRSMTAKSDRRPEEENESVAGQVADLPRTSMAETYWRDSSPRYTAIRHLPRRAITTSLIPVEPSPCQI